MSKKKTIEIKSYVALNTGYGRYRLGDPYGVTKALVIDVDLKVKKVARAYGARQVPPNTIRSESRGRFSSQHDDYISDAEGEPMNGWVVVEYSVPLGGSKGEKMQICIRKQKVLGTWKEHEASLKRNQENALRHESLRALQRDWDENALKIFQTEFPTLNVTEMSSYGNVKLDARKLLTALGHSVDERPS